MSNLKAETRLILERQRLAVALRTSPERKSSGAAVILCTDVGRTELGNHSVVMFAQLLGLMCYSWSSSFWHQRLIFNHHTNDVFSEVPLIVSVCMSSLRLCVCVCAVCVSVKESVHLHIWFAPVQYVCVNSGINKKKNVAGVMCPPGYELGALYKKKKKKKAKSFNYTRMLTSCRAACWLGTLQTTVSSECACVPAGALARKVYIGQEEMEILHHKDDCNDSKTLTRETCCVC